MLQLIIFSDDGLGSFHGICGLAYLHIFNVTQIFSGRFKDHRINVIRELFSLHALTHLSLVPLHSRAGSSWHIKRAIIHCEFKRSNQMPHSSATTAALAVRILFNPSRRKQFSNLKLCAISSNSASLFPRKCSAHSFTRYSATRMLRDNRPTRSGIFHTGAG